MGGEERHGRRVSQDGRYVKIAIKMSYRYFNNGLTNCHEIIWPLACYLPLLFEYSYLVIQDVLQCVSGYTAIRLVFSFFAFLQGWNKL